MGLSIRRGATKEISFTIPPFCDSPDANVDTYQQLPAWLPSEEDIGKVYKVEQKSDEYPARSYFKWDGNDWIYINSDTMWQDLGSIHVRIVQGSLILDKEFSNWQEDILTVKYTQDDTIRLTEGKPAKLQVLCVDGDLTDESALKSQAYQISVLDSLWNEAVHNE